MKPLLLGSLLITSWVFAASPGGPALPASSTMRVRAFLTAHADAAESALVLMEPGRPMTTLMSVPHAPGMVPRGVVDPVRARTWMVVADGPSRLGEPASLWTFVEGAKAQKIMGGLMAQQRPVLAEDGRVLVLSDDGMHENAARRMILHAVDASGKSSVIVEKEVSWMVPLRVANGAVELLVQDGPLASIASVRDGQLTTLWSERTMLRDVTSSTQGFLGTEVVKGGGRPIRIVDGKRAAVVPAVQQVQAARDVITVPLERDADGRVLLVRMDSVDKRGRADSRLPPAYAVPGAKGWLRIATRGALLEPVLVGGAQ